MNRSSLAHAIAACLVSIAAFGCVADTPNGARVALLAEDGDPWEPGGGGGGGDDDPPPPPPGGGGTPWILVSHSCWGPACSFRYVRPAGSCTDAEVLGPGCGAAMAEFLARYPGSTTARCAGAIFGCQTPGQYSPCTGPCEMSIAIEEPTASCHPTTNPCPQGYTCLANGDCVPACDPTQDDHCAGGYCDRDTGLCTSCSDASDCDGDAQCVGGRCVESCDPMNPGTCSFGRCDPTTLTCVACIEGACPEGQVCDPNNGRCRDVEDCSDDGICPYGRCIDGTCQACPRDFQCTSPEVCDPDWGRCTDGCTSSSDCLPGHDCIDGICRDACASDFECDRTEYCEGGYCRQALANGGTCPRANMVLQGTWCYAPCTARHEEVCGFGLGCDATTGDCRIRCGDTPPICPPLEVCVGDLCIDDCDPRVTTCSSGTTCSHDVNGVPYCGGGGCAPGDHCCGVTCPGGAMCDPATGLCAGGFDPCAGVYCGTGSVCEYPGVCVPTTSGCTFDWDCSFDDVCEYGVCVPGGTVDVCALDGACTAGETCSCEPWCCGGGGGGGGGTGRGGGCGWDGGSTISYGDCHACGGSITWWDGAYYCEGALAL